MRRFRCFAIAGSFILGISTIEIAIGAPYHFCVIGDMPYYLPQDFERFDNVIDTVNEENPAFTVHVGDTKSGSAPCSDEFIEEMASSFKRFDHPLVYTPGDNEWTDCHRDGAGNWDPIERLAKLRERFFSSSMTLGGGDAFELEIQASDAEWERYVENRMWEREGIVFGTVHVVGSRNNRQSDIPGAMAEFRARDRANDAWLKLLFETAENRDAAGIALFIHANPFGNEGEEGWDRGFTRFLDQFRSLAIAFGKPVLLTHGDSHYFRLDKPLMHEGTVRDSVENVTRLEVFGATNMHAIRVDVDSSSARVFRISELIVEANRK